MDDESGVTEEVTNLFQDLVARVLRVNPDWQLAAVNNTIKDRASIDGEAFSSITHGAT